jgi:hypothetical protein
MTREIGRLNSFGLGIEATAGTAVTPTIWVPCESANVKPITENVKDESGIGVIDAVHDAHIVKKMTEVSFDGIAYSKSIGAILLGALGASAAPSLVETGAYSHAMTRKNDNSHPSFTLVRDNQTQEEKSAYCMLEKLDIDCTIGSQVKYKSVFKGQSTSAGTTYTPAFDVDDEPFLVSKVTVKFANDIASLGAASAIPVNSVKFSIDKKLTQIFQTATTAVPDATEFTTQHNQDFMVSGDFEMVYEADTYKTLAMALTKQAMQIEVTGTTLIGATQYNKLTIQFASVVLEDWDRSTALGDIMTQTFGFTALYKLSETKTLTATLINKRSTQYIG